MKIQKCLYGNCILSKGVYPKTIVTKANLPQTIPNLKVAIPVPAHVYLLYRLVKKINADQTLFRVWGKKKLTERSFKKLLYVFLESPQKKKLNIINIITKQLYRRNLPWDNFLAFQPTTPNSQD